MEYKKDAEKILAEFSMKLKEIPKVEELYYDLPFSNILRTDSEPKRKDLYKKFMKIVPRKDEKGYVLVERAKLW